MGGAWLLWPLAALAAAVGLHAVAPHRAPLLYLGPAAATAALLALPTIYIVMIWSH